MDSNFKSVFRVESVGIYVNTLFGINISLFSKKSNQKFASLKI
jgi:hypothetical protein